MTSFFEDHYLFRNTVNGKEIYYIGKKIIHYNCEFCFDTQVYPRGNIKNVCGCQRSSQSFSFSKIMKAINGE